MPINVANGGPAALTWTSILKALFQLHRVSLVMNVTNGAPVALKWTSIFNDSVYLEGP